VKLGVLLDDFRLPHGGAERHTDALMKRALQQGVAVVLASIKGEPPEGVERVEIQAAGARPERDELFAEEGVRALHKAGCDVVLAFRHAPKCDVYLPHGGVIQEARDAKDAARGGVGVLKSVARTFSRKHTFFLQAEQALLGDAEGPVVIAVSQSLAGRIQRAYPAAKHRIVPVINGVDTEHFDPEPFESQGRAVRAEAEGDDAYVGLFMARNPVLKGLETVIEAMARPEVTALPRTFRVIVAGARPPRRLRQRAKQLGVASRLHVIEDAPDPRPLYAAADVLVHPTWYDPCSLVCLESLAMGTPVITTPVNGVRDVMGQRGGIVIEEPGNPKALAVALGVLADDDLRAMTSDDARYLALKNKESTRLDRVLEICREQARQLRRAPK